MKKDYEYTFDERMKIRKIGENLPMTVKWDDMKIGSTYHMPPVMSEKRFDFKVVDKSRYWITIKKINSKNETTSFLYNYDISSKFIVPLKK